MLILPFTSLQATLEIAGGKGANLVRLTRAGFDVPPGFIISTQAYREFVLANDLEDQIMSALAGTTAVDSPLLEAASARIRAAFSSGKFPLDILNEIQAAYAALGSPSVAVRSSATAEDLPDLSFAGQQDTFLNIIADDQLHQAVIDCWSSLWTARAIGYRLRNNIPHADTVLAVVVQQMVQSEVSGVLFTANPLSGLLSESVIDATFGLGEALVSGQVEPDHFVVNSLTGAIVKTSLGAKKLSSRARTGGGIETTSEPLAESQTLTSARIYQLVAAGQAIQFEYAAPQDIEWAFVGDSLYILQSRAITSLFPVPQISYDPLKVWISFGAVQGLLAPITPLGQDTIRSVMVAMAARLGVHTPPEKLEVFGFSGERIWIKISDVIRHPIGSRVFAGFLGIIEPSIGQILKPLATDPRIGIGQGKVTFSTLWRLLRFFLPIFGRLLVNMLFPQKGLDRFNADIENSLADARIPPGADRFERLAHVVEFIRIRVGNALPFLLPRFIPVFGPGIAGLNFLIHLSGDRALALEVTRSLPHNVTTEMDLVLWEAASTIRAVPSAAEHFSTAQVADLAAGYANATLPVVAQTSIDRFMQKYGMRGVGEIDFGQPRWREDASPVIHTLQSYLLIDPAHGPDVLFARGEKTAAEAVEKIVSLVHAQPGGWVKEKIVRAMSYRVRVLMAARESPKLFAIRTMGIGRQALLEVAGEFVAAGTIDCPEDLVFLNLSELETLSNEKDTASFSTADWRSIIKGRRSTYEREKRRRQVPRVLASDGRAFYEGLGSQTDTGLSLSGSPVSPGAVEGLVHIIFDPRGAQLAPGEILVCPGTDPAWTPLFMAAAGLITEVGGMMTHGSVVAREYGIPAVVGVHQATTRLKNGQRIRIDGTTGLISILP